MKVLIVGGGGREHAIALCAAKSSRVDKIYCAAGNAGIGQLAELVPIQPMEIDKLVAYIKNLRKSDAKRFKAAAQAAESPKK